MNDWLARHRVAVVGVIVVVAMFATSVIVVASAGHPAQIAIQAPTPRPEAEKPLIVYVTGAVTRDGVYSLKPGSRVCDAISAAGGTTGEADLTRVNMARRLTDEMWVHVPRMGEGARPGIGTMPEPQADAKININTATAEELDKLPGIGPVTAAKIIDYRSQKGSFTKIEDLRDLKLVYASVFEKIKDKITVE